jgi:serine/threonine protein kinase
MEPRRDNSLELRPLNEIHPGIDPDDICSNGKLLSDAEILRLKKLMRELPNGRYTKSAVKSPYPIVKLGKRYLAVYKGLKSRDELGAGSEGYVKLVQDLDTGDFLAIKAKPYSASFTDRDSQHEIAVLTAVNAVVLDDAGKPVVYDWSPQLEKNYQRRSKSRKMNHTLLELAKGTSLEKYLDFVSEGLMKPVPIVKCVKLMLDTLTKVEALYREKGILHCDIKLENILATPDMKAELIDWGYAEIVSPSGVAQAVLRGTPKYLAPELYLEDVLQAPQILLRDPKASNASRLIAMTRLMLEHGVIRLPKNVFAVLESKFPEKSKQAHFVELKNRLQSKNYIVESDVQVEIKKNNYSIVTRTEKDQVYALGIVFAEFTGFMKLNDQAIFLDSKYAADPRLEQLYNLIAKMLEHDPAQRLSLAEAKSGVKAHLQALSDSDREVSIAILRASEIEDYYSPSGVAWSDMFVNALRDFDEVYLMNDGVSNDLLARLHHCLCRECPNIMPSAIEAMKMNTNDTNAVFDLFEAHYPEYSPRITFVDVSTFDNQHANQFNLSDSDSSENSSLAAARSVSRNLRDLSSQDARSPLSSFSPSGSRSASGSNSDSDNDSPLGIGGTLMEQFREVGFFQAAKPDAASEPTPGAGFKRSHSGSMAQRRLKPPANNK